MHTGNIIICFIAVKLTISVVIPKEQEEGNWLIDHHEGGSVSPLLHDWILYTE